MGPRISLFGMTSSLPILRDLSAQRTSWPRLQIRKRTPEFPARQFQTLDVRPIRVVHIDYSRESRIVKLNTFLKNAGITQLVRAQMIGYSPVFPVV